MAEMEWKGYTFDELKYQRALVTIKCEIEKEKLISTFSTIKQGKMSVVGVGGGNPLLNKLLGALDIADYSFMAFKFGRKLYSIFNKLRKK